GYKQARGAIVWVSCLSIFGSAALGVVFYILVANDISFGVLSSADVRDIGVLSFVILIALIPRGLSSLHVMFFNSLRDTRTPFIVNVVSLALFLSIAWQGSLGLIGVGLALAVTYWVIAITETVLL